ncbi:MAG: hypothetical protein Q9M36_15830 [Sulfurovum sp.]|nr:hypothetical protein [Sulfurovum sp.]
MQMVKKTLFIVFLLWFSLLAFMPKSELYYTLEKQLYTQEIVFNEAQIEEGIFSLVIKDVTVYVKGIAMAHIEAIEVSTYLFFTTVEIHNIEVEEALHNKVPALTKILNFSHSLTSPLMVILQANGSFGSVEGVVSLDAQKVKIDFIETKKMDMLKPLLVKSEKGWSYEKSF